MNRYFEQTILNADPIDLIRIIYQRAIACTREAREHLREKRIRERSESIMRAYAAIAELLTVLQPEAAPGLGKRLQDLYSYMLQRLLEANMGQSDPPLAEVLDLLITLSDGWTGVAAELMSTQSDREVRAHHHRPAVDRWDTGSSALEAGQHALSA